MFGKKNAAHYSAASKGSESLVFQPGVFHNKEEPEWGITATRRPWGWHGDWGITWAAALQPRGLEGNAEAALLARTFDT